MRYSKEDQGAIYDKTDGRCHICHKQLAFTNYGQAQRRGAWEVDHSVPRARGGTDNWQNLLPACVSCNRAKQAKSTRAARAIHGHTKRPRSRAEKEDARAKHQLGGALSGFLVGARLGGFPGALVGLCAGVALADTMAGE